MAFRIITGLCLLILAYAGFETARLAWLNHRIYHPKADFLVQGPDDAPLTVIAYIDYRCGNCDAVYAATKALQQQRPDLRYITMPLPLIDDASLASLRLTMAAGLEGKFQEMHQALIERRGDLAPAFLRETASLYGMDYDALVETGNGEAVERLLNDNYDSAEIAGVSEIPSFLIGKGYYAVPKPIENVTVADLLALVAQEEATR